ncbi:hypothetical protein ACIHFD_56465 [Nonomuraea sp. NPDC051941]|uniref:hypothetical protein n=1 Tax=Nonomuraea sp. NPDC051941 TaxID=3364373 RepID=UPI0037CC0E69
MADVTQADVVKAEREAAADAARVETLKTRIMSGEAVTPDELAQAQQLAEWSELRVVAVRQQCQQTRERKRQKACADLRTEMETNLPGDTIAAKLRALQAAATDYFAAVEAHNQRIAAWRKSMQDLGIPEHNNPIAPPEIHARLGWGSGNLYAGRRRINRVDPGMWLTRALEAARATIKDSAVLLPLSSGATAVPLSHPDPSNGDPYERLAALDEELPESGAQYFYRGSGGAVIARDTPYPPEEIKRLSLRIITRKEAWGE